MSRINIKGAVMNDHVRIADPLGVVTKDEAAQLMRYGTMPATLSARTILQLAKAAAVADIVSQAKWRLPFHRDHVLRAEGSPAKLLRIALADRGPGLNGRSRDMVLLYRCDATMLEALRLAEQQPDTAA